jgi:hypothetical protein
LTCPGDDIASDGISKILYAEKDGSETGGLDCRNGNVVVSLEGNLICDEGFLPLFTKLITHHDGSIEQEGECGRWL